jgi:hypothetical protein
MTPVALGSRGRDGAQGGSGYEADGRHVTESAHSTARCYEFYPSLFSLCDVQRFDMTLDD